MTVYIVNLLYMGSDYIGDVFLDRIAAETYAKRQLQKDDWLQGYNIVEREVKGVHNLPPSMQDIIPISPLPIHENGF